MKKVTLFFFEHRDGLKVGLDFKYDLPLKEFLKQFPGLRWTKTFACFYINSNREQVSALLKHLENGKVRYDDSLLDYSRLAIKAAPALPMNSRLKGFERYLNGLRFSKSTVKTYMNFVKKFHCSCLD